MAEREKLLERITVRLDEPLMGRLERHARSLEEAAGVRLARAEVLRKLVERGLDAVETDNAPNEESRF